MDAMKYLKQLMIIMAVSFAGELLNRLLPLPVPGSVYGLVLMFLCLLTRLIRLEQVEDVGEFLIKLMPVLFIGPGVSLITVMGGLADKLIPILAVCIISTIVVMVVTGLTAQAVLRRTERRRKEHGQKKGSRKEKEYE